VKTARSKILTMKGKEVSGLSEPLDSVDHPRNIDSDKAQETLLTYIWIALLLSLLMLKGYMS